MTEFDPVNKPKHYNSHPSGVEVIQITRECDFAVGNAIKYIMRHDHKGTAKQDLEKARWYLKDDLQRLGTSDVRVISPHGAMFLGDVIHSEIRNPTLPKELIDVLFSLYQHNYQGAYLTLDDFINSLP